MLQTIVVALAAVSLGLFAQSPELPKLDQQIKAKLAGFQGHVTLYAKNLDTGASYSLDGNCLCARPALLSSPS